MQMTLSHLGATQLAFSDPALQTWQNLLTLIAYIAGKWQSQSWPSVHRHLCHLNSFKAGPPPWGVVHPFSGS